MPIDTTRLTTDIYYSQAIEKLLKSRALSDAKKDLGLTNNAKSATYALITINPKDDINPHEFITRIHKMTTWKWISDMTYAFEQRGECKDDYHGLHCHMVLNRGNKPPAHIKDQIYRSFQNLLGSKQSIDYKSLKTEDDVSRAKEYVLGNKKEEKNAKCINDKLMRKEYNLEDYYVIG